MKTNKSFLPRYFFWGCMMAVVLGCGLVQCDVSYDRKSLIINGRRRIIVSGSIHYPRSTPEMWEDLIMKAKEGGLDAIETYVFWNLHEPSPGRYNFEGNNDLVRFLKIIQRAGLYAVLRIGPYVCAEWNFGGFPVWLKNVPGIRFRTDNEPFKNAMEGFTRKIVDLMKSENLFASQGGPIIISQIENEYGGSLEKRFGAQGYKYMTWAANMAVQMNTGVPWMMCKQDDAPDPLINACNGFYCDDFSPNRPYKPKMWTEAWTGWFTEFGSPKYERPVQDLAFAVADFFQKGGSFVNYYMYHGGTNFGRTAGGPFLTTSYDYDAPLDEYGMLREPKHSHLKELHKAIKLCERALVSADPSVISLGRHQQAYVYHSSSSECAAFLSNYDTENVVKVFFNNRHYKLHPKSISILANCQDVIFNTAVVGVQTSHMRMISSGIEFSGWESFNEDLTSSDGSSTFTARGLMEQIDVTNDYTDYLWYTTNVHIDSSESFLRDGKLPILSVQSTASVLYVYVNGILYGYGSGTRQNRRFTFKGEVNLRAGSNTIRLLSVAVGLPNIGTSYELWPVGILGTVTLRGLDQGKLDLTRQDWTYQVGLKGETMNLAYPNGFSSNDWAANSLISQKMQPLTWMKSNFDAPDGAEALALDLKSMGKGQVWINGRLLGRYWTRKALGNCSNSCSYTEHYQPPTCQKGCRKPTQRWYHVPLSWLKPTGNQLVLFEELGGDPRKISLVKRSVGRVCATVAEYHPNFKNWQTESEDRNEVSIRPSKIRLKCNVGQFIRRIKFASYGTPVGTCGRFKTGTCHAPASLAILEKKCVGKQMCNVAISNSNFGRDPCPNDLKWLSVEARCA